MFKRAHLALAAVAAICVLTFAVLRGLEWQEQRELAREVAELQIADQVRTALVDYRGAQCRPLEELETAADVVRALRGEGRLEPAAAEYVERHRERFHWERQRKNFDVAWLAEIAAH